MNSMEFSEIMWVLINLASEFQCKINFMCGYGWEGIGVFSQANKQSQHLKQKESLYI